MANQIPLTGENQELGLMVASGTSGTAQMRRLTATDDGFLNVNASVTAGASNPGTASNATANYFAVRLTDGTAYYTATGGGGGGGTTVTVDHGTITLSNPTGTVNTIDHGTVTLSNPTGTTVQFNNGTVNMLNAGTITSLQGGSIVVTAGTVQSNILSGTINAGTTAVNGGTLNIVQNGTIAVKENMTEISGLTVSSLNGDLLPSTDVTGYRWFSMHVGGTFTGTIAVQGSNDNVDFRTTGIQTSTNFNSAFGTAITGTGMWVGPIPGFRYLRMRMVAYTSGTALGVGEVSADTSVWSLSSTNSNQSGAWNVTGTIAAGTVTVGVGTINHGTIDAGTVRVDARTTQNILSYGTTFAATASAYATVVGSAVVGVGTSTWVQDMSINNPYGTTVCLLGFGTALNGTSVVAKGVYGTQTAIGIEKSFSKAVNCGMTNQDLVIYLGAAGTVDFNVSYLISA